MLNWRGDGHMKRKPKRKCEQQLAQRGAALSVNFNAIKEEAMGAPRIARRENARVVRKQLERKRSGVTSKASSSATQSTTSTLEHRAEEVLQWLDSEGVNISAVRSQHCGVHGVGVVARQALSRGSDALRVPRRLWLTPSLFEDSQLGEYSRLVTKPWLRLALYLMLARSGRAGGALAPYIDSLPEITDSPLFWTSSDAHLLEGTQLHSAVQSYLSFLEREYSFLSENVFSLDRSLFDRSTFSFDRFVWAFAILRSRALPPCDSGSDIALIPGLDLANYSPSASGSRLEKAKEGFFPRRQLMVLKAHTGLSEGDEIFVDYGIGQKNDRETALDFGFIEPIESKPAYQLSIRIPNSDPLKDDKDDCLSVCSLSEEPTFDLQPTDPVPDGLLPALRLLQLGGQDAFLLEATFRDQILSIVENPISKENEAAVYEYMLDGCRQILSGYSTSSDEERSVLQSNDSTLAQRTASLITLGEKQSLRATMDEFEAQLGRLDSLEYYQERRLRQLGLMDEEGDRVPLDPFREIENSM